VGKSLTTELVFIKTKSDSLQNIKNLNLWGNDLEDLSLIEHMPNLEVISLSVNKISSLKYFANCQKLQVMVC
jgi:Leucine-rich repeat (LRR) protein